MRNGNDGDARFSVWRKEQALNIERLTRHPGGKARGCEKVVQGHRQLEALFGRIKGLEIKSADLVEGRFLHGIDQTRQIQAPALAPGLLEHRREQNMLAALQGISLAT